MIREKEVAIARLVARVSLLVALGLLGFAVFWFLVDVVVVHFGLRRLTWGPAAAMFLVLWGHNIRLSKKGEK